MKTIEFNHVTTEATRYRIELDKETLDYIEKMGFDINNEDHEDDIINLVRDYNYEGWIELSHDTVDGHFQDGVIVNE